MALCTAFHTFNQSECVAPCSNCLAVLPVDCCHSTAYSPSAHPHHFAYWGRLARCVSLNTVPAGSCLARPVSISRLISLRTPVKSSCTSASLTVSWLLGAGRAGSAVAAVFWTLTSL